MTETMGGSTVLKPGAHKCQEVHGSPMGLMEEPEKCVAGSAAALDGVDESKD